MYELAHTTTGCGKQGFPSAQPYLSHTPGANPFCCMFLSFSFSTFHDAKHSLSLLLAARTIVPLCSVEFVILCRKDEVCGPNAMTRLPWW
ncbi:hypothetical protein BO87DRAFT_322134 [Aspergillus neoniger CBS 115656]|uniref:Uncharacterized protein n=1 Tax=Aspergillus neoniger (strain CBS 115656) TaxID=1448310 RepID=A0A318Y841_ASPNB|nr:hypothetical protein BO87DRAFT_322134 [Aspergillus neoniger CBS 115656]PYH28483.1 hypothetical protein BO87DRAFT_322134 [Aspergillus neoniger CBS 115656]